MNTLPL